MSSFRIYIKFSSIIYSSVHIFNNMFKDMLVNRHSGLLLTISVLRTLNKFKCYHANFLSCYYLLLSVLLLICKYITRTLYIKGLHIYAKTALEHFY